MKKLITACMLLVATALMGSLAQADCGANTPTIAHEAMLYLSFVERGGIPPFGWLDPRGPEVDSLCQELKGFSTKPMDSPAGYTELTLDFGSRTCSFSMIVMPDGRSDDMNLISCTSYDMPNDN